MTLDEQQLVRRRVAERIGDLLTGWVDLLPPRLRRRLPRDVVGFAILSGFTFLVDMTLLTALHTWTTLPLTVAYMLGYAAGFGLNFVLNRIFNFRSHAPVGGQALRYAMVVACDFGLLLGVTSGLTGLGLDFRLARLATGACTEVLNYCAYRWWIFRDRRNAQPSAEGVPPMSAAELAVTETVSQSAGSQPGGDSALR